MLQKLSRASWVAGIASLAITAFTAATAQGFALSTQKARTYRVQPNTVTSVQLRELDTITIEDVNTTFDSRSRELHAKVDATRVAYHGFIFPITREDFAAVADALDIKPEVVDTIYNRGATFSSFRTVNKSIAPPVTNHIAGGSIMALKNRDLDTGLASVTDENLAALVTANKDAVFAIAKARPWFGRIFFPAETFSNALAVYGAQVSPDAFYKMAQDFGYTAMASDIKTVRGDFGISVWLTLLAKAP